MTPAVWYDLDADDDPDRDGWGRFGALLAHLDRNVARTRQPNAGPGAHTRKATPVIRFRLPTAKD